MVIFNKHGTVQQQEIAPPRPPFARRQLEMSRVYSLFECFMYLSLSLFVPHLTHPIQTEREKAKFVWSSGNKKQCVSSPECGLVVSHASSVDLPGSS